MENFTGKLYFNPAFKQRPPEDPAAKSAANGQPDFANTAPARNTGQACCGRSH